MYPSNQSCRTCCSMQSLYSITIVRQQIWSPLNLSFVIFFEKQGREVKSSHNSWNVGMCQRHVWAIEEQWPDYPVNSRASVWRGEGRLRNSSTKWQDRLPAGYCYWVLMLGTVACYCYSFLLRGLVTGYYTRRLLFGTVIAGYWYIATPVRSL